MAQVNVAVYGRTYTIACGDGEEEHVQSLARTLDRRVNELAESVGHVGDARLLLMTALLLADELSHAYDRTDELESELTGVERRQTAVIERADATEDAIAEILDEASRRIENIAVGLSAA
jgi:cell division protein ZapA